MLAQQDRLALFSTRDDDIDSTAVRVVKKLARMCVPSVEPETVTEQPNGGVRFVHAGGVFEIREAWDEEYELAAAAFDLFLAAIDHPQRVFAIGDDGAATDNEAGVFFCADPARMPGVAAQIGYPVTPVRGA